MKGKALAFFLALTLLSCGTDSRHFKFDGRFKHLNQGEFYVYSPDGGLDGLDTIKVESGRFAFEMPCSRPCILMLVFPNFSEQPIFAEPGKSVSVKGDASHLKEMEVTGTKDNELMNKFRQQIANASPPDTRKYASLFVEDHPNSPVGLHIVSKYFMQSEPNYQEAKRLLGLMTLDASNYFNHLKQAAANLSKASTHGKLPSFKENDMEGNPVGSNTLAAAKVGVVTLWSSWSYESMSMQRELKNLKRKWGSQLQVVGVCVDGSKQEAQKVIDRDTIPWANLCDGDMMMGKVVQTLGLASIPDNIITQNGKIVAHGLNIQQMKEKVEELLAH
ncbi:MAG: DUF4369 domain-containing protein [Prevotella sp.]|nr:DUF4369 domain-containing protein [Prevotella sp.]